MAWSLYTRGGVKSFYRGFFPTMLGAIPYTAGSFYTYEMLKSSYYKENGTEADHAHRMSYGALAGLVGQTTAYPLDIIRRRMQTAELLVHDAQSLAAYSTIRGSFTYIVTKENWHSLFRGLSINWIKGPIAVCISFSTFDLIISWIG